MENDVSGFTVAVIGLGLMGGSLAARLSQQGRRVLGWNRTAAVAEEALARGFIASAAEEDLKEADLVVFCTPQRATEAFLQERGGLLKPGAVLTDIAGVKDGFPEKINRELSGRFDFVAGHPMCGREGAGLSQADPAMFDGASWLITPVAANREDHIRLVEGLARLVGARPVRVTPEVHDAGVAYTSDLTHTLAVSLMNSASFNSHTKDFMGGSFRDETRVADINSKLWTSLFLENKDRLLVEMDRFSEAFAALRAAIAAGDREAIGRLLDQAGERKRSMGL